MPINGLAMLPLRSRAEGGTMARRERDPDVSFDSSERDQNTTEATDTAASVNPIE